MFRIYQVISRANPAQFHSNRALLISWQILNILKESKIVLDPQEDKELKGFVFCPTKLSVRKYHSSRFFIFFMYIVLKPFLSKIFSSRTLKFEFQTVNFVICRFGAPHTILQETRILLNTKARYSQKNQKSNSPILQFSNSLGQC